MTAPEVDFLGANADQSIRQTWQQVEERVVQMAGGDRSKIKQLNIDNVLQCLDQAQASDKKSAEKYGVVRNIFNRTLQCIQTVGGIVADGASYAFAPAGTCYNALTFVIQAWQGYEGIFESLASLLEKCTEFLDRLSYYTQSGMDSKLTKVACQHLQIFVEICDRSLKLKLKRHKFSAFMKQMFLNDDGVQDLLGAMKNLVDKERGLVSAQTWKSSNEAAANSRDGLSLTRKVHNTMVEEKNQQKRDKELQKWKLSIVDALECERTVLEEDTQPWEKTWKRHKSKILEGSGEWLVQDPRFKAWATESDTASQILGLEGEDGSGKTLLASNVIRHLRKATTIGTSASRVVVAHNFVEPDSKSSTNTDTVISISRSLMCQLALGDEPFMKSVAAICEKAKFFDSPLDMWTQLLLQNEDIANIDVNFFIVLDGLGPNVDMFTHLLQKFSDNSLVRRTRILLTGRRDMFESIERVGGLRVEKIALGQPNKQDVELYINHRMENMEILKDITRPGVAEMREKILRDLQSSTEGDYYKIGRVLDNVSKTDDVEEINSYLQAAGDARPDQIEDDIEKLNQTRTAKEISEINEIILWVWAGREWLSPREMEAALALKAGSGGGTSLMSMESKIKTKYTIFSAEDDLVDFKVGEILDKIPLKKKDTSDEDSSSGYKEIQPAEISIIKHYLSAVCPPDLYTKIGFDEFFDLKMVRKGNYICKDEDNGHITMVLRCLTGLEEERNETTELLASYCMCSLFYHLGATDLSLADRSLKAEVGIMLVRLFTEKYALDSFFYLNTTKLHTDVFLFSQRSIPPTWHPWVYIDEGVNMISKWFKDSAVIEKVKDNALVTAFNAAADPDRHHVLFATAMRMAAENLFRNDTTKQEKLWAFIFLYSLVTKNSRTNVADIDLVYAPTPEMVQLVEDWSQKTLGVATKDSTWEAQAATLLEYLPRDHIPTSQVEERARRALELDPKNWRASYTLSLVVDSPEDKLALTKGVVDQLMDDAEWRGDKRNRSLLASLIIYLGDLRWEYGETEDEGVKAYSKILDIDRSYPILEPFSWVLARYASSEKWSAGIDFLERLVEYQEDEKNAAGAFIAGSLSVESSNLCAFLSQTIESTGRFDLLETLIAKAKEIELDSEEKFYLLFNHGQILFDIKGHEEAGTAIWEAVVADASESKKAWAIDTTLVHLIPAWMRLATAEGTTALQTETYYSKIESWYDMFESKAEKSTANAVVFAQYFRQRGDEDRAKRALLASARGSLEMLYDDDIENDTLSFWDLSQIFSAMRDVPNISVAWDMMAQVRDVRVAEYERELAAWKESCAGREKTPDDGESGPTRPDEHIVFCDVLCGRLFTEPAGFWSCLTESGQVQFCDACYLKLKAGALPPKVCGKDHEHFHMVRDAETRTAVPKGSVAVGDRVITLEEWKQEIKAKYVDFGQGK
ncbi:hypothetical protein AK830_g5696 [Neonectria ditissima]|uniref:Uncharacterized protein n=1 Tax=Neonectria ditissima TaxID=78410 RepID=A0A0P7BK65_9HYPO|nr:hypothetical protein AK830_g5696 [Neonectria ditissima]